MIVDDEKSYIKAYLDSLPPNRELRSERVNELRLHTFSGTRAEFQAELGVATVCVGQGVYGRVVKRSDMSSGETDEPVTLSTQLLCFLMPRKDMPGLWTQPIRYNAIMRKTKPFEKIATQFGISAESAKYFLGRVQKSFKSEKPPHQLILDFMEAQEFELLLTPYEIAAMMNESGVWDYPLKSPPPEIVDEEDLYM